MNPPVDTELVDLAVSWAREAGDLTLGWFGRPDLAVDHKDDGSPVTEADRGAEDLLRRRISERFPDDAIHGEEEADRSGTSGRLWIIDPIDGTKAFTHGVPLYSTLLAVLDEHGPAIGVIHLPALSETVWAGRGRGCLHNGNPCRVSEHPTMTGAYLMTSGLDDYWPRAMLDRAIESEAILRTWGDGYGYALVATGRAEAMIDPLANPWDVAAMATIIEEAGGRFSDLDGVVRHDGGNGVASNGTLHEQLLELLVPSD